MKKAIHSYFQENYQLFYGKYLPQVKKIGGVEFVAICPFHDDKNPSFNFNGQNGKFYCHGCAEKGDIFNFYAKLNGLKTQTDFKKILKGIANDFGISRTQGKKRVVKHYVYKGMNGKPLHRTVRTEPKNFYQERYESGK